MAKAINFAGQNITVGPPPGSTDIGSLPAFMDGECVVSCWKLTDEEYALIRSTGCVWVSIMSGNSVFPLNVAVAPMTDEAHVELVGRLAGALQRPPA